MPSSTATVQLTPDCLKPRPLRTSAVMISPGGPVMFSPMLAAGGGGSTPLVMVNTVSTAVTSESVTGQTGGVNQGSLSQGQGLVELGGATVLGTVELLPLQSTSWAQPPPGYKKASQFTGE